MAKTITVPLTEPLTGHEGLITHVVLRAPNLIDYAAIGEPFTWAIPTEGAQPVYVENDEAIARYVEACVVEPKNKALLTQVGLEDGMTIKDELLGFFLAARRAKASRSLPTS